MTPSGPFHRLRLPGLLPVGVALLFTLVAHAADGPALFEAHCASCHGDDGRGRTPQGRKIHARDLTASRATEKEIVRQIREGSRVKAGAKPPMPAFGDQFTSDEVAVLVAHVVGLRR